MKTSLGSAHAKIFRLNLTPSHLGEPLPEGSYAVQHLVEHHPEGPDVHLGTNSRVVAEALGGEVPAQGGKDDVPGIESC